MICLCSKSYVAVSSDNPEHMKFSLKGVNKRNFVDPVPKGSAKATDSYGRKQRNSSPWQQFVYVRTEQESHDVFLHQKKSSQ